MNQYIYAQILNITTMAKTFQKSCELAAIKDDGTIDKTEEKQLKAINKATERFIKQLKNIK